VEAGGGERRWRAGASLGCLRPFPRKADKAEATGDKDKRMGVKEAVKTLSVARVRRRPPLQAQADGAEGGCWEGESGLVAATITCAAKAL
jgi:hypothetical protein